MNSRALSSLAMAGFVLLGALCFGLRYQTRQEAQSAREDSLWQLAYKVSFEAGTDGAELRLALPYDTSHCVVQEREFVPQGLAEDVRGQQLFLSTRQPGKYDAGADFDLQISPRVIAAHQLPLENLTPDDRQRYLREESTIPIQNATVQENAQPIRDQGGTTVERVNLLFNYCRRINTESEAATDDVELALKNNVGTPLARARAMVALCRAIKIPARLVTGFEIRENANAKPRVWVEVFEKQSWVPYDPGSGYSQSLPMDFLPVRRGGEKIVNATGVTSLEEKYLILRKPLDTQLLQAGKDHPTQIFDLTRLPVPMHDVMKLLWLLPFAALITVIMRNVIGIQTFGTFSPALLAMSFIYADWETGLAILIIVLATGLFGRSFLERLRLLMVPRLSIVLTSVILCVVFCVSLLEYLALTPSAQAVLLPMVILTMLIERFHVSVEEDGLMFTLHLAVGTIVVAALCYLVLRWETVGSLALVYPEIHFLTIAVFIALGRYAGYRLTELWRFRDMVETPEAAR